MQPVHTYIGPLGFHKTLYQYEYGSKLYTKQFSLETAETATDKYKLNATYDRRPISVVTDLLLFNP